MSLILILSPLTQGGADVVVNVSGVAASGALGSVTVSFPTSIVVPVTGVVASGAVGTLSISTYSNVYLIGVQALGLVATPLVWSVINEGQTPSWQGIDDAQIGGWGLINSGQTPGWQGTGTSPPGSWVQVADGNTVTWVQIPS